MRRKKKTPVVFKYVMYLDAGEADHWARITEAGYNRQRPLVPLKSAEVVVAYHYREYVLGDMLEIFDREIMRCFKRAGIFAPTAARSDFMLQFCAVPDCMDYIEILVLPKEIPRKQMESYLLRKKDAV
jgi:hypothetical protein